MGKYKNPDIEVETIQDLIFYQYAKIIAKRAFSALDERGEAKTLRIHKEEIP